MDETVKLFKADVFDNPEKTISKSIFVTGFNFIHVAENLSKLGYRIKELSQVTWAEYLDLTK